MDTFCKNNNIKLYYFDPNNNKFYTRNGIEFTESELDLYEFNSKVTENIKIRTQFINKKKERQLTENESKFESPNQKYLSNKSIEQGYISLGKNGKLELKILYNFMNNYCKFGKIKTYIILEKEEENTINYDNNKEIMILGLCKNKSNIYIIKSIIYNNYIFEFNNPNNKKFIDSFEIDVKEYDLLVWIQFEDLTLRGNIYKIN